MSYESGWPLGTWRQPPATKLEKETMMSVSSGTHVVLGAAGGTGSAIVTELLGRGLAVRTVTRTARQTDGAENVVADLSDPDATARALTGATVVYHAANPPYHHWLDRFPALNRSVIAGATRAGARLVFTDNLYMYGPQAGVMTETTPTQATDKKGRLRIQLADELMAASKDGQLEVVIGRSPDYFGAGGRNSALGEPLFGAALSGRTVRWVGKPDVPHSVAYLPDMARAFVTLGLADEAAGRIWHLPSCGAPTGQELIASMSRALDTELQVRATPRWILHLVGLGKPAAREVAEIYYQWAAPFVSSDAAFEGAFGPFESTPLDEAVAATMEWFKANAD
jgi:nucleoside-diphosphate-sugar epimerase